MNLDQAFWTEHAGYSSTELHAKYPERFADSAGWRRAKRAASKGTPQRGVAVYDLHHPQHDKKLWRNILRFMEDFSPDVFVFGGDNMHMEVLSHWVHDKRQARTLENQRIKTDYTRFTRDVLEPLEDTLTDDCRRIFLLGNHEDWANQYVDKHPHLEGLVEVEANLPLDDWEVCEMGLSAQVGKLHFIHGEYTNKYSAAKTVEVYGRNIIYGHGHTYQAFTNVAPLDSDPHVAIEVPCACTLNPDYARNKPNRWVNGFLVFYVLPNGNFQTYPVIAVDGAFTAPTGVRYE